MSQFHVCSPNTIIKKAERVEDYQSKSLIIMVEKWLC